LFLVENSDDEYPSIGLLVKDTVAPVEKLEISFPYMARIAPHVRKRAQCLERLVKLPDIALSASYASLAD
jgi:hypothetical protein